MVFKNNKKLVCWLFLLFGDTASFWEDQTVVIAKART